MLWSASKQECGRGWTRDVRIQNEVAHHGRPKNMFLRVLRNPCIQGSVTKDFWRQDRIQPSTVLKCDCEVSSRRPCRSSRSPEHFVVPFGSPSTPYSQLAALLIGEIWYPGQDVVG